MKKQKLKKRKQQRNQHYFKIDSWFHYFTVLKNNGTIKHWNNVLLFLLILLLPSQFGKHFFFDFSYLSGIRVDYLAPTLYLTDILALTLIFLNMKSVFNFFIKKKVLILISLLFLNVLVAHFHPLSIYRFVKILELLGVIIIFRQSRLSTSYILSGLLIGAVFQLFLSTAQFVNKHSLQGLFYFFGERPLALSMPGIAKASLNGVEILRPYGTFSHPNSLAGFYLLIYFFLLTDKKLSYPLAKNILLLICSLVIFITFSKIVIITFLFLNFIYLWKSPLRKNCSFCFFARTFILLIISFIFLQAKSDPLSLQKRIQLMDDSRLIIRGQPFFGTGLGKYLITQQKFPQLFVDFFNQPVHNIFLLFLGEVGLITGLAIFFLLFNKLKSLIIKYPYIFTVLLITGIFDHYWLTLQQNFLLTGTVIGLLLNSNNQFPRNKQYSSN